MLSWIFLFAGGLFEVCFVVLMKLSKGFTVKKYTILSILAVATSLYLLALALQTLPLGVGYAVWAGIGAVGTVLVGIIFFRESRGLLKMFFVSLVILGIIGLKLSV